MLRTKERFFNPESVSLIVAEKRLMKLKLLFNPVTNSVANPLFYAESLQKRNAYAQFTENRTFALISQKRGDQVTTILGSIVKLRWEREVQRQLAVSKAENTNCLQIAYWKDLIQSVHCVCSVHICLRISKRLQTNRERRRLQSSLLHLIE